MFNYLSSLDWPTLLAFAITVLTITCTTIITIKYQKRALDTQVAITREVSEKDKERSRAEFISNSRQLWINSLRDEVSCFISESSVIWDIFQQKNTRGEFLKQIEDPKYGMTQVANWSTAYGIAVARAEKSKAKIRLLLNPGEPTSSELMLKIDFAYDTVTSGKNPNEAHLDVISTLQPILKTEWERVKKLDGA